ncbi:hypothetical protein LXA43DRAFT_1050005, partial [Ganoderma leucocontextum]
MCSMATVDMNGPPSCVFFSGSSPYRYHLRQCAPQRLPPSPLQLWRLGTSPPHSLAVQSRASPSSLTLPELCPPYNALRRAHVLIAIRLNNVLCLAHLAPHTDLAPHAIALVTSRCPNIPITLPHTIIASCQMYYRCCKPLYGLAVVIRIHLSAHRLVLFCAFAFTLHYPRFGPVLVSCLLAATLRTRRTGGTLIHLRHGDAHRLDHPPPSSSKHRCGFVGVPSHHTKDNPFPAPSPATSIPRSSLPFSPPLPFSSAASFVIRPFSCVSGLRCALSL